MFRQSYIFSVGDNVTPNSGIAFSDFNMNLHLIYK